MRDSIRDPGTWGLEGDGSIRECESCSWYPKWGDIKRGGGGLIVKFTGSTALLRVRIRAKFAASTVWVGGIRVNFAGSTALWQKCIRVKFADATVVGRG